MTLSLDKKNRITEVVKKILTSRHESFPDATLQIRNAPFHSAVLKAFSDRLQPYNVSAPQLIALSSWFHGLSTSLGTGYEHIGHILSGGYKRSFTSGFTPKVTELQQREINLIIADLKRSGQPDLSRENERIFNCAVVRNALVDSLGFSADIFVEHDTEVVAIELKSVRPNSGEGRGEKQKILYGKAALKLMYPNKSVKFYVGFPFDPTAETPTGCDKARFIAHLIEFGKFFDRDEILLGHELWDYLSGVPNTMEILLSIVEETAAQFNPSSATTNT